MAKKKAKEQKGSQACDLYALAGRWALLLSLAGVIISAYTFLVQYSMSGKSMCRSCLELLKDPHSIFAGIPVTVLYLAVFILLLLLTLGIQSGYHSRSEKRILDERQAVWACVLLSVTGLGITVYHTHVQGWVMKVWCLPCVVLSILVTALLALYLMMKFSEN